MAKPGHIPAALSLRVALNSTQVKVEMQSDVCGKAESEQQERRNTLY